MPRDRDRVRLLHMLEHAREAMRLVEGHTRQDFDADRVLSLAVVRLLEILGEAAARVSPEARAKRPDLLWWEIIGMRNRLIHGYDAVDLDIVWNIVESDILALVRHLAGDPDLKDSR